MRTRSALLSFAAVLGFGLMVSTAPAHAERGYGHGYGGGHFEGGEHFRGGERFERGERFEGRGYGERGERYGYGYGPGAILGGALFGLGVGAAIAPPPPPVYYAPRPYYTPYAYAPPPPVYVERRTEYVEVPVPVYRRPVARRIVHPVHHAAPPPCVCLTRPAGS